MPLAWVSHNAQVEFRADVSAFSEAHRSIRKMGASCSSRLGPEYEARSLTAAVIGHRKMAVALKSTFRGKETAGGGAETQDPFRACWDSYYDLYQVPHGVSNRAFR